MPSTEYRGRKGYKNLRIGAFRAVLAWENRTYNFTFYAYIDDSDYMLDFILWPWNFDVSFNKF